MTAYVDPRSWTPRHDRAVPVLAAAFLAGRAGDMATTALALAGGAAEGNPLPAAVLATTGALGMAVLQALGCVLVLALVAAVPYWRRAMLAVAALTSWVPLLWNVALMSGLIKV